MTVDPPDAAARLSLGPQSDFAVPADGRAVVKDLPDGEHELIVQAPGYQPLTTRVTVKDGRGSAEAKLVAVKGAEKVVDVTTATTYIVKAGDSIWSIAKRHKLSVADLTAANGIADNANP